jgi:hypothetical protein
MSLSLTISWRFRVGNVHDGVHRWRQIILRHRASTAAAGAVQTGFCHVGLPSRRGPFLVHRGAVLVILTAILTLWRRGTAAAAAAARSLTDHLRLFNSII